MAKASDILDAIYKAKVSLRGMGMFNEIVGAPSLMDSIALDYPPPSADPKRGFPNTLFGVRYVSNPMFPIQTCCADCGGSGEGGVEATYCPKCEGTGGDRIEGMMRNGAQTILMRSSLPKKFAPHFPKDIPLPRRAATRSRDIPWPEGTPR